MPTERRAAAVFVHGKPEGQSRPRWGSGHFYSPKTAFWESAFLAGRAKRPRPPLEGPLGMHIVLYFQRPKSVPAWAVWMVQRPDGDNVGKAILDSFQAAGWYADDKAVARLVVEKRYAAPGFPVGAAVTVETMGGGP